MSGLVFPRDLTPHQRHNARLGARKVIEREKRIPDRVYVVLQDMLPPPPRDMPQPMIDAPIVCHQIELRVARASCPVHPEMLTILHLDEKIDGNPCPICWAAVAVEWKP